MKVRLVAVALAAAFIGAGASPVALTPAATTATPLEQARSTVIAAEGAVKADEAALASAKSTLADATGVVSALSIEPPPPAPSAQLLGVNAWPLNKGSDAEHEHEAVLAAEHGSTLVRISTLWEALEPSRGTLSAEWLAHLDKQVNAAAAHGEKVILTVATTPKWANGGGAWNLAPTNPADYGAFCLKLVQRYGSKVIIEVWNEPNGGSTPLKATAKTPEQAYGEMAKAAITAIAGRAKVLVGALYYTDTEWLKRALAAGDVTLANGTVEVSFHPYADGAEPGNTSVTHSFKGGIERVHVAFPGDNLWPDEFGYRTLEGGMSEATRAQRIKESFQIVRGLPYVVGATSYELRDKGTEGFGLVNGSFTAYPALAAFTEALA